MHHNAKPLPAAGELWARYSYNPLTGTLISRTTGKPIKGHPVRGHLRLDLESLGGSFYVHRVIWKWCYGSDPAFTIDHINRNRADNRLGNLRQMPVSEQLRNHGKCRLDATKVSQIKARLRAGESQRLIAADYGVHRATIGDIKTGRCWSNVG